MKYFAQIYNTAPEQEWISDAPPLQAPSTDR